SGVGLTDVIELVDAPLAAELEAVAAVDPTESVRIAVGDRADRVGGFVLAEVGEAVTITAAPVDHGDAGVAGAGDGQRIGLAFVQVLDGVGDAVEVDAEVVQDRGRYGVIVSDAHQVGIDRLDDSG